MRENEDPTPWYRQFWPWFVILLPASAVVGSLYTVSLAVRTSDSLVITSDGGVDVVTERNLAAERRARELGLVAYFDIDTDSGAIAVDIESREPLDAPAALELLFSHPTDVRRDQRIPLSAAPARDDGAPRWVGHFVDVPSGRWYVVLSAGDDWRLSGTWSGVERLVVPAGDAGDGA